MIKLRGDILLAQERKNEIMNLLEREGSVKVSMLVKLFEMSIETVRRDLESLEKDGLLKRVYGGAVLNQNKIYRLNYSNREKKFIDEKKEISKVVVKYIEEGQSIALNNSTTNIEVARELKKHFKKLTIITNSLMITSELADAKGFTVILTGGVLNNKEFGFYGEFSENVISNFMVDKAILSVSGVSLVHGITDYLLEEVQIEKKLMSIAQEVIILVDSSKIDNVSLVKVSDIHNTNLIITDSNIDPKILKKYLKLGIEIVTE